MENTTYWKTYFDAATIERSEALRRTYFIPSNGVQMHIEAYEQPEADAPVIMFNHGGGGYSRLFVRLALALYDRGYTVILPDQYGQGYSEGKRGDATLGDFLQSILDAAAWADQHYAGPLFMAGGSIGGGVTYMAAAAGAPARAFICHNLYTFASVTDSLLLSRFAPLVRVPGVSAVTGAVMTLGARLLPGLRLPLGLMAIFERMVDARDTGFYGNWLDDPLPLRTATLRYMHSLMATPPAVPLAANTRPVLVINPTRDRMVAPEVTRQNYEKLGGPKGYAEIDYEHFSLSPAFTAEWVEIADDWFRLHLSGEHRLSKAAVQQPQVSVRRTMEI